MTDETEPKKRATDMSRDEYREAVKGLLHEAVDAEMKARNDRAQAAVEAKYSKDAKK